MQRAFDRLSVIAVMIEGPQLRITADTAAYRRSPAVLTRGQPGREPFAELVDQRAFEVFGDILRTGEPATVRGFRTQLEVIDIVFGDRVTLGGFIEVVVLVLTMILARLG